MLTYWPIGYIYLLVFKVSVFSSRSSWCEGRPKPPPKPTTCCVSSQIFLTKKCNSYAGVRSLTLDVSEVQLQTCLSSPGLFHLLYSERVMTFWPTLSPLASHPCNQGKSKTTKMEQHSRPPFSKRRQGYRSQKIQWKQKSHWKIIFKNKDDKLS